MTIYHGQQGYVGTADPTLEMCRDVRHVITRPIPKPPLDVSGTWWVQLCELRQWTTSARV